RPSRRQDPCGHRLGVRPPRRPSGGLVVLPLDAGIADDATRGLAHLVRAGGVVRDARGTLALLGGLQLVQRSLRQPKLPRPVRRGHESRSEHGDHRHGAAPQLLAPPRRSGAGVSSQRELIAELVHRYADAVVHKDRERWAACWAEDAHWYLSEGRTATGKPA